MRPLERAPHVRYAGQGLSAADADLHRGLRKVLGAEREVHLATLARAQMNPLESAQTPYRRLLAGSASDIQLHDFIAVPDRSILNCSFDCCTCRCPLRPKPRILKSGVAQPKAERVQRLTFKISVGAASHGVICEWRQWIHVLIKCHRETARRVADTGQGLRDCRAGLLPAVPCSKQCTGMPGGIIRGDGAAAGQDDNQPACP